MKKNSYSLLSKLMHRLYLSNYYVAKTSYDIEQTLYKKEVKNFQINKIVFVTGLARAGTTALFRAIYETEKFASLRYSDMPFLLMPIIWSKNRSQNKITPLIERAHKDGIKVNSESPEAFDEYFWKSILDDNYIDKNFLKINSINNEQMCEFEKYIKSICISNKKNNYLSKNNNNILRIQYLLNKFPSCKIIMVFREPVEHAKSLLKQHINFSELQNSDPFALEYFNYLGHHEFGLNHKPFKLSENESSTPYKKNELNYWLVNWLNYYKHVLLINNSKLTFISFSDICNNSKVVSNHLTQVINSSANVKLLENFKATPKEDIEFDIVLSTKCSEIYEQLNNLRTYK